MTGQVTLDELMAMAKEARMSDQRSARASTAAEDAITAAVRDHARFVFKVAYSVVRNREDAEDAVQETFIRAMRHAGEFAGIDNRRAWLARTAWRLAIDRTRKMSNTSLDDDANEGLLAELRAIESGTEELVINDQMLSLLRSLIAALPGDLRDVVTLSTVNEMTSAEMSSVLGIPEASVRTRLFRARQMLKEKFTAVLQRTSPNAGAV